MGVRTRSGFRQNPLTGIERMPVSLPPVGGLIRQEIRGRAAQGQTPTGIRGSRGGEMRTTSHPGSWGWLAAEVAHGRGIRLVDRRGSAADPARTRPVAAPTATAAGGRPASDADHLGIFCSVELQVLMMCRPAARFLTMPLPPLPLAARIFAAFILPPRLFFAMLLGPRQSISTWA